MTEFVDDELPLPPFAEIFGEGTMSNKKKKMKNLGSRSDGLTGEETTGRWTPEEHRLFLEGIMLYGKDWKKMQPLIKTRTLVQIRTHAQKVFKKIGLKKMNLKKSGNPMEVTAAQLALLQQHLEAEDNANAGIRPTSGATSSSSTSSSMAPPGGHSGLSYNPASLMMPLTSNSSNIHNNGMQHQQQQQQQQQQHTQVSQLNTMSHHAQANDMLGQPHLTSSMVPDNTNSGQQPVTSYNNNSANVTNGSSHKPGSNTNNNNLNYGSHYTQVQAQHINNNNSSNNNNNNNSNSYGFNRSNSGSFGMVASTNTGTASNNSYGMQIEDEEVDDDDLDGVDGEDDDDLLDFESNQATQQSSQQYHYQQQQQPPPQQYQSSYNSQLQQQYMNHPSSR